MVFLVYQVSDICNKIKEFQLQETFTDRKLSNNTLMEEIKSVVLGKYEFEYRDLSITIYYFWPFLSFLAYQSSILFGFFNQIVPLKVNAVD